MHHAFIHRGETVRILPATSVVPFALDETMKVKERGDKVKMRKERRGRKELHSTR